ncbi:hypothetical protein EVAR_75241_1 [Eumeta japonica]|uniref:Uncharacterized protein n=1 Tax=Eumeta variegata TaxID=151549 RepID=A0A4C1V842_EUMVA|nr:hypothetical protein EVAR_75241_1 [Eumeta japonica]
MRVMPMLEQPLDPFTTELLRSSCTAICICMVPAPAVKSAAPARGAGPAQPPARPSAARLDAPAAPAPPLGPHCTMHTAGYVPT